MEQRVSIITLGVSNLEKSRVFYQALGWSVANEDQVDTIVAFNLQQMALVLYPKEKLAEDANVDLDGQGYSNFTLAYNVASEAKVNTVLKEAIAAGGTIIKPAQKAFWGGYSGYFSDPDNFLWEVAFNPFSKLGEKGEFQWS